ncbi:MAG: PD40 domain-containing protein [Bacteroidales bacterium]|nr:PD40 domain-containing protein [Bacteroidales bacterium]
MIFLLIAFNGFSQSSLETKANDAFLKAQYVDAIKYYEQLLVKNTSNFNAVRNLGYAYKFTNQNSKAELHFKKLIESNMQKNQDVFAYAQVLKQIGKFQDFDIWMKKYAKLNPNDKRVIKYLENPNYVQTLLTDSLNTEISYLDINSEVPEFAPNFYKNKLCFVSARGKKPFLKSNFKYDGGRFLDIYTASILENKELDSIFPLIGNINTSMHEGPLCFTNNDSLMYFTRNYYKAKIYNNSNSENKLRIAVAELTKNGWKQSGYLFKNDIQSSYGHPAVSFNGEELVFVSDRPGGFGGTDLYKCVKINGAWSKPQNLGTNINTEGNEMFPYIDSIGTLFFASDGHLGLGGLDIFYSPYLNEKYQMVINVGVPINSNADDFGLVLSTDLKTGYFSSNRSAGLNDDDLYRFKRELGFGVLYSLSGYVLDKYKNIPISDAVLKLYLDGVLVQEKYVDNLGFYQFNLKKDKNYVIKVSVDDYNEDELIVSTFSNTKGALSENIYLEPIKDLIL